MKLEKRKKPPFFKLRGILFENRVTYEDLSNELGRSIGYIVNAINRKGNASFTLPEVVKIATFLDIPQEEWTSIFLAEFVEAA